MNRLKPMERPRSRSSYICSFHAERTSKYRSAARGARSARRHRPQRESAACIRARAQFDRALELQPGDVAVLRERAEASLLESELGEPGAEVARARAQAGLARIGEDGSGRRTTDHD
jgi:hypothetical protein